MPPHPIMEPHVIGCQTFVHKSTGATLNRDADDHFSILPCRLNGGQKFVNAAEFINPCPPILFQGKRSAQRDTTSPAFRAISFSAVLEEFSYREAISRSRRKFARYPASFSSGHFNRFALVAKSSGSSNGEG